MMLKVLTRRGNIVLIVLTIANIYLLLRKFGVIQGRQTLKYENPIETLHLTPPPKPSFQPRILTDDPSNTVSKETHTPSSSQEEVSSASNEIDQTQKAPSVPAEKPSVSAQETSFSSPISLIPSDKQPQVRPPSLTEANLRLPHALIVGAARCGTNPLLSFLSLHSGVAPVDSQLNFFNRDENYKKGLQWYSEQMPNVAPGQVLIERSPGYIYSAHAPKRVQAMNSSIKVIFVVRDPIKRAVSSYAQIIARRKVANMTYPRFESTVIEVVTGLVDTDNQAIDSSIYHVHLQRWLRVIPLEQIHVVDGEMFIRNPVSEIRKIETFLGLDHRISEDHLYFNSTSGYFCVRKDGLAKCYRHPPGWEQPKIDHRVLEKLRLFFSYHNQRLFKIVKQRFDWL